MTALPWTFDDGGRAASGRRGHAGDCVVRAIAIATGADYDDTYDRMARGNASLAVRRDGSRRARSARNGVAPVVYKAHLAAAGWVWTATMGFGTGTTHHVAVDEVPMVGPVILRLSRHLVAVVDGVVRDTGDPGRGGSRAVYGWWTPPQISSR
jgi:hypothetical protein